MEYMLLMGINLIGITSTMGILYLIYRRGIAIRVGFLVMACLVIADSASFYWGRGEITVARSIIAPAFAIPPIAIILVILFRQIVTPVKLLTAYFDQIAQGTIPQKITQEFKDEFNESKHNLNTMIETINQMLQETNGLIVAVQNGQLATRGKVDAFAGSWRDLIQGINQVIEAFVTPINLTAQYIHRIAQGDLPEKITQEYQGDFNTIKTNLNSLIEATHEITQLAEELADGNLDIEVHERSEQDTLMYALNMMIERLREVVLHVKSAATNVAISSKEMRISADQMSQRTSQEASATEEASASLEEMAANIKHTATNALQTEKMAIIAAEDAKEGEQIVIQTITAMKTIVERILIIQEIAQETRILSLNATFEAARASEYGKAFLTVAAEVRKLADTTKTAAEEIKLLSHSSVEIAEQSGTMLAKMVPNSQKTAELAEQISAANSEQSTGIDQINTALQQVGQMTQQNIAMAEEVSSMAEELAAQAIQLQSAVEFFKLDNVDVVQETALSRKTPVKAVMSKTRHRKHTRRIVALCKPKRSRQSPRNELHMSRQYGEDREALGKRENPKDRENLHNPEFEKF